MQRDENILRERHPVDTVIIIYECIFKYMFCDKSLTKSQLFRHEKGILSTQIVIRIIKIFKNKLI